jgi:UDP-N-acetylglucosamine 2-epimerase (non-hydrolysing)
MIGNIMIDSFNMLRDQIESAGARETQSLEDGESALVTLHRPSNVAAEEALAPIVSELVAASEKLPVVFVAHPRTIKSLEKFGLPERLEGAAGVTLFEPLTYIQFMNIVIGAKLVNTDSGGCRRRPLTSVSPA